MTDSTQLFFGRTLKHQLLAPRGKDDGLAQSRFGCCDHPIPRVGEQRSLHLQRIEDWLIDAIVVDDDMAMFERMNQTGGRLPDFVESRIEGNRVVAPGGRRIAAIGIGAFVAGTFERRRFDCGKQVLP